MEILFKFANEFILIRIEGRTVFFSRQGYGNIKASIDGLKLDYVGTIREFPDLELEPNWRHFAIARFKDNIEKMKNTNEIADYLISDLKKFGYKAIYKQDFGGRRIKLDGAL